MNNYLFTDCRTTIFNNCLICGQKFKVKRNTFGKYCSRLCFYKVKRDDEWKKRISLTRIKKGLGRGSNNWMYGKTHTSATRLKISITHKGEKRTKIWRDRQSNIIKKLWSEGKYHKAIGRHNSPKTEFKKGWKNETLIKKMLKGLIKRPTSLEKQMIEIIRKHNLPYRYTGNGSFLIGYKNPDFVNINGEKKLIEVGNTFHHKLDYVQKRSDHFKKYGWESIIFLTNKLNEIEVLKTLNSY